MSTGDPPPPWPYNLPLYPMIPMIQSGCICPPGANRDCENPSCPRKPFNPPLATGVMK